MSYIIRETLETVKSLRAQLHGDVDDSVICDLDRVIRDLELLDLEPPPDPHSAAQKTLELVGIFLDILNAAGLIATVYQWIVRQ